LANKGKYSPYPGDIVDAKLEPGEYVLNRNAVNAIGEENLNKLNNVIAPRFRMNEGGSIMDRLNAARQFNQDQYNNPSVVFKDNSLFARMDRRDKADDIAYRQAKNERIKQYHDEIKAIEHEAKMRKFKKNVIPPLQLRKQQITPIDLQKVEVPEDKHGVFNTDDFNNMMGIKKMARDFGERHGLNDSQGRGVLDEGYGTIKGIDPKTWTPPKSGKWTKADQLMALMSQDRNKKFNTHIDEDNPEIAQVYKDNPLMDLQREHRKDNLQRWSDEQTQKTKDKIASEYSPYALHNADIREELIGDPNDPSDDYGSSLADAMKRSDERSELWRQNQEIAMMNPGKQPDYFYNDRKTGKLVKTDRKGWLAHQAEGGRLHKERMKDEIISKDGLRMGSKSKKLKEEAEFRKQSKVKVPKILEGNRDKLGAMDKARLWAKDRGDKWSKAKAMRGKDYDKYLQAGGMVGPDGKRRYNVGAFVKGLGESGMAGANQAYQGLMGLLNKGGEGISTVGGAIGNRYGGQQYKDSVAKQKSMGIAADLNKDIEWGMEGDSELAESNIDMAKMLRDEFGEGDQYVDKEIARNEAIMGGASQVGQDVVAGAKALPGLALGAGAVTLGAGIEGAKGAYGLAKKGGEALYKGGKSLLEHGFDKENEGGLLADASYHLNKGKADDYGDVWSGKAKGSLLQRGKKGLGGLGMLLQDASQAQGFQGADWAGSGIGRFKKTNTKTVNDEAKKTTDIDNGSGDGQVLDLENAGDIKSTEELVNKDTIKNIQLNTDSSEQRQVGTGVILNQDNIVPASSSTSGGNTNIFNKQAPPEISDDTPQWLKEMSSDYVDPNAGSGVLAPDYDPSAPAPQFNVDDLTKINIGGGQTGGRVSLEGFIQQSWRNMR